VNFDSSKYGYFLVVVFCLFWAVARFRDVRFLLLLAASWFFYASWKFLYLGLIVFSTLLDYWVGGALYKLDREDESLRTRRRLLLLCSLVGNLGLLAVFKYYDVFIRTNIEGLFGVELPFLGVALPVGISFYTFQTLSYTIDIYRGTLKPARNMREFALFVAFFPQLVAGPIVRAADFLPQLDKRPSLTPEQLNRGLYRIMVGLAKKVIIADVLALGLVTPVFDPTSKATGLEVLLGIYGYALRIYCDFSGYSDIAIGSALLLGFRIPENFNAPYLARSIQDFWRRWHISLSTWLRDYLYIPLGGNRKGTRRTYINLALTMLLGGLWHGAAWHFVAWGGLHGLWLGVNRWWDRHQHGRLPGRLGHAVAILITFHMVCFAWVFFRARDFGEAANVLDRLFSSGWAVPELKYSVWFALAAGFVTHFLPKAIKEKLRAGYVALPALAIGGGWAVFLGLLKYCAVGGTPFIYFQF